MRTSQLGLAGVGALLLAIAACSEELEKPTSSALRNITITARDFEPEASTRTDFKITDKGAEFAWAANDTVGIFPETGAQAYFPMTSGAGTKTASFSGGGWALKDASRYAAYYPFVGSFYLNREAIPVNYTGQTQVGDASTAHLGAYDYMAAAPATPQGGNANFAFNHLGCLVQLKLTVPQATALTSVTISTEEALFAVEGTVNLMSDLVSITPTRHSSSIRLDLKEIATTADNQVVTLYLMLPPTDLSGKELTVTATIQTEQKAVATLTGKNLQAGRAYALATTLPVVDPTTHIQVTRAGTLSSLIGNSWDKITTLSISGPLNGDDIRTIRKMAGRDIVGNATDGSLTTLDISKASIVGGGNYYCTHGGRSLYTEQNVIGEYMFRDCNLISVSLPEDVTVIDDEAFYSCRALKEANLPESLLRLGDSAFAYCNSLKAVDLPPLLESLEGCAFLRCHELVNLNLPKSLKSIGWCTFAYCHSLTTLNLPNSLTSIGDDAFEDCTGLTTINFPNSLISIGDCAFSGCTGLTKLDFPESLTNIENSAFYGCI